MSDSRQRLLDRVAHNTQHHAPDEDRIQRHHAMRLAARSLMVSIADLTPESREQSLALTAAEEALMWANAAIARYPLEEN